mmetsp:Transcript_43351/g.70342  ORF Transcript_43351/g.70342 Transcript_43351/m.70342 type:complete len:199 (-) Transcript_43351:533-1129(-)
MSHEKQIRELEQIASGNPEAKLRLTLDKVFQVGEEIIGLKKKIKFWTPEIVSSLWMFHPVHEDLVHKLKGELCSKMDDFLRLESEIADLKQTVGDFDVASWIWHWDPEHTAPWTRSAHKDLSVKVKQYCSSSSGTPSSRKSSICSSPSVSQRASSSSSVIVSTPVMKRKRLAVPEVGYQGDGPASAEKHQKIANACAA